MRNIYHPSNARNLPPPSAEVVEHAIARSHDQWVRRAVRLVMRVDQPVSGEDALIREAMERLMATTRNSPQLSIELRDALDLWPGLREKDPAKSETLVREADARFGLEWDARDLMYALDEVLLAVKAKNEELEADTTAKLAVIAKCEELAAEMVAAREGAHARWESICHGEGVAVRRAARTERAKTDPVLRRAMEVLAPRRTMRWAPQPREGIAATVPVRCAPRARRPRRQAVGRKQSARAPGDDGHGSDGPGDAGLIAGCLR